jgi:DNA-binding FrmR family transcriptional regulator
MQHPLPEACRAQGHQRVGAQAGKAIAPLPLEADHGAETAGDSKLEHEKGCATVLHLIVAARGAMNSLMTEVIEDHIRLHVVHPIKDAERVRGAEELIEAVQAYLK